MTAVVSLGSNLGDRLAHLRAGVEVLRQQLVVEAVSAVYETDPVGVDDSQSAYLNAVAILTTDDAERALAAAQLAEAAEGRERPYRWAPRTLDVDVVAVDGFTSDHPRLTVPHPRAHERAFVLLPCLEVEPAAELPGLGSVRDLLSGIGEAGVHRYAGPEAIR
jgi:2-amino-4-hydroxy-6-hydroxymethyldihydropteridine diphosphokinase